MILHALRFRSMQLNNLRPPLARRPTNVGDYGDPVCGRLNESVVKEAALECYR